MSVVHGLNEYHSKTLCGIRESRVASYTSKIEEVTCGRCLRCAPSIHRMVAAVVSDESIPMDIGVIVDNLYNFSGSFVLTHSPGGDWTASIISGVGVRVSANTAEEAIDLMVEQMGWSEGR